MARIFQIFRCDRTRSRPVHSIETQTQQRPSFLSISSPTLRHCYFSLQTKMRITRAAAAARKTAASTAARPLLTPRSSSGEDPVHLCRQRPLRYSLADLLPTHRSLLMHKPDPPSLYNTNRCLPSNHVTEKYIVANCSLSRARFGSIIAASLAIEATLAEFTPRNTHYSSA